ncbi:MAG: electron transfer flavoprotein subunit beta [Nitrospirae bacterium CG_4_9_14_3_um_filter_53_35]|nr:MAG: electron transfer flavoprotein subunit beta [Nitrospirae bacterium CG17_big_fil_post_rev_8_21_14_2_50_50_9]PJA77564.1 MAG: electron transfer flavoprotein subunit beta [Nitrospirae bacterium CG_4_9_14_3_um_filter_53_35]
MNIVVCIKQVPDVSDVRINPETHTLIREGVPSIINPFDMYAIEEGIRLRERFGGKVTVLTMGPPQAEAALRDAVSMGADDAVLLSDRAFAGSDTLATSYTLSMAIRKFGSLDVVICGKQAIDGDTAQVGPEIAENLQWGFAAYVRKIEDIADGSIRLERLMDDGYDILNVRLPAVITVVKEINRPRLPSLKGKMQAKKMAIPVWTAEQIGADPERVGLKGSPTKVWKIFTPEFKRKGERIEGEPRAQVDRLISEIRRLGIV